MSRNRFLNYIFGESHIGNSSPRHNYERIMDRVMETSIDYGINNSQDEWLGICLSGYKYGDHVEAEIDAKPVVTDGGTFYDVKIFRVDVEGKKTKQPFGPNISSEEERRDIIRQVLPWARSEKALETRPSFREVVVVRNVLGRLTYTPTGRNATTEVINPIVANTQNLDYNKKMGYFDSLLKTNEDTRDSFEKDLKELITKAGMSFAITSRTRTVDKQISIMKGKPYSELKKNYGLATAEAIRLGDDAELRRIWEGFIASGEGSSHLRGLGLDLRSKTYSDAEMATAIRLIKKLGGSPYVEPATTSCWANRSSANPRRLGIAGGNDDDPRCYAEHIHITVPANYISQAERTATAAAEASAMVASWQTPESNGSSTEQAVDLYSGMGRETYY